MQRRNGEGVRVRSGTGVPLSIVLVALAGCVNRDTARNTVPAAPQTRTLADGVGRAVTLPAKVDTIISLSPSTTETIFVIGCGERLVGVDTSSDYPKDALAIAKMGDFGKPNLERIVASQADLIVGASSTVSAATANDLQRRTHTSVFTQQPQTVDDVPRNIEELGTILGVNKKAEQVAESIRDTVRTVERRLRGVPRRSVFIEIWNPPLMTTGGGTLLNELVERAGGKNIAADLKQPFPNFSLESLLEANPDVYIVPRGDTMGAIDDVAQRPHYQKLKAVQQKRFVRVPSDLVFRPGPRIGRGLYWLAWAIHPEQFPVHPAK